MICPYCNKEIGALYYIYSGGGYVYIEKIRMGKKEFYDAVYEANEEYDIDKYYCPECNAEIEKKIAEKMLEEEKERWRGGELWVNTL